jgi:hypothetical protein
MRYRIVMNIITMPSKILLITNQMLPKPPLPEIPFPLAFVERHKQLKGEQAD